jgi:GTP-binding protein
MTTTTTPSPKKKSTTKKPLKKPSSHQTAPIKRAKLSTQATPVVNWKEIDLPLAVLKATFITSAPSLEHCPPAEPFKPEIVMVGRSNVGKSSWINAMFQRKGIAKTSNTPGKTRLINYYDVKTGQPKKAFVPETPFPDGKASLKIPEAWYFVDLPGYGYAKVAKTMLAEWSKQLERYIRERESISLIIQLIDARHGLLPPDEEMLGYLIEQGLPFQIVLTKADKCSNKELQASMTKVKDVLKNFGIEGVAPIQFSAETAKGKRECWQQLLELTQLELAEMPTE